MFKCYSKGTQLLSLSVYMTDITFFWHDYEAGGVNPRADRPTQFAGIRTNEQLEVVGKPVNIFCQLSPDYLPHPEACLITGITPQQCQRDGHIETEFAAKIAAELSQPGTVGVGYNNIRYDDEMTRFLFYRNFIDPYAHTWANNNSRWDLIDLVRACYALRPEGIVWPTNDDGAISLKLELLTKENNLDHGKAHDAMSDVYATIALAKLIKDKQPKLFDWAFSKRRKAALLPLVNEALVNLTPLVHVSGLYGATNGYCRWVLPLGFHPEQPNQLIAWRLDSNPELWHMNTAEALRDALYASGVSAEERPGLVKIQLNQSPFLAPRQTLSAERAAEFGQDITSIEQNATWLRAAPDTRQLFIDALATQPMHTTGEAGQEPTDVDLALYSGGLISRQSQSHMKMIRNMDPIQLSGHEFDFDDPRFNELLFRFRARNYPHTLSQPEIEQWRRHCQNRLELGSAEYLSLTEFVLALENSAEAVADDPAKMSILRDLYEWVSQL